MLQRVCEVHSTCFAFTSLGQHTGVRLDLAPGSLICFCGCGKTCLKMAGFAPKKETALCLSNLNLY